MLSTAEIKDIVKRERLSISKRRGQNFLVEPRIQKRIIDALEITPADEILEIGPGLGALTGGLIRQAAKVVAVEKDAALARILKQKFSACKKVQIIWDDILKVNLGKLTKKKMKVVGNLPYYITTPIIGYLLERQRDYITEMYITVQDEVGRRMLAKSAEQDYSAFSLLVQYFSLPETLFAIPKRAFYPQPRVDSLFLHLHIRNQPPIKVNNSQQFFKIIRTCFSQRRKIILNSLTHKLDKQQRNEIQQALTAGDIDVQLRPEMLSLAEFSRIEDVFYKKEVML